MARQPVLTSTTLSPFGGGGGGFGAFSVVNPGREAYLAFLKKQIAWNNGELSNTDYLAAYQTYVNAQAEGSSTRLSAQQSLDQERYRLERNDLMNAVEAGTSTWADLVAYDKSKLEGLDHSSQEYLDRLNLYQSSQSKALSDAANEQQDAWNAGQMTTAQLRAWYVQRAASPDLSLNPDLGKQLADQIKSLDLRLTSEADQHELDLYSQGKIDSKTFLTYAAAAQDRYQPGTTDYQDWAKRIDDAKQSAGEGDLTYRYGISQDYIQLQKYIADQTAMLKSAGSSTSTSQRIVLGANGQWKVVTQTSSHPYKPSASEQKAMQQRQIELADAKRQLAQWTTKITEAGGFVTTDQMLGYYQGRLGQVAKGSDEWYTIQNRIDSLQKQKHTETVLAQEGVRITFGASNSKTQINAPTGGGGGGGGGLGGSTNGRASGSAAPSGTPPKASTNGPLEVITGAYTAPHQTPLEEGQTSRTAPVIEGRKFPTNLDGSAFTKFYSGFTAAYKAGETSWTDYSSGKPITYYIPADLAQRAAMIGQLDDLRISYYATRAQVYAGTASEYVAAKEYSDAIKDKADNAYMILVTKPKGAPSGPVLDPIAEGLAVYDQAKQYIGNEAKLAKAALDRGDLAGAYAHIQLATRTAAETEAKMNAYGSAASRTMGVIEHATGEAAPTNVQSAFDKLTGEAQGFTDVIKAQLKPSLDVVNQWAKKDSNGNPEWNPDGSMSVRDGAGLSLDANGNVTFFQVPSAGYTQKGSQQQTPDVPGKVRVTVNLGGFSPTTTVYADWHAGVVGFDSNGNPIQGKVVSTYVNGRQVTLVENPFAPGTWSQKNQTFKVPPTFKAAQPVSGFEGATYSFTSGGKNYLLGFDQATGQYSVITPGTATTQESIVPLSQPDAQALLQGAGFQLDKSGVAPGDQWQYGMTEPFLGFDKTDYDRQQALLSQAALPPVIQSKVAQLTKVMDAQDLQSTAFQQAENARLVQARADDNWLAEQAKRQAHLIQQPPTINPVNLAATRAEDAADQAAVRDIKSNFKPIAAPPPLVAKPVAPIAAQPPVKAPTSQQVVRRTAPKKIAPLPTVKLTTGPYAGKSVPVG